MTYTSLEHKIRKVMAEAADDRNTKLRMKVTNVGRPDTATDPTDVNSKLAKQGEIKTKIIDEEQLDELSPATLGSYKSKAADSEKALTDKSSTLSVPPKDRNAAAVKANQRRIGMNLATSKMAEEIELDEVSVSTQDSIKDEPDTKKKKQDKTLVDAGTIKGGKTEVDLEPTTDDRNDDGKKETDKAKKATREANKLAGVKEETMLKSNSTFGLPADLIATVTEALKGGQKNIDKNHNGKVDAQDFKILRGETKAKVKPQYDKARPAFKPVEEASDEKLDTKGPDGKMPYNKTKKIVNKAIEPFKEESATVLSDEETARLEEIVKSLS